MSEANAELVRSGAKLSLEDMESEHFSLISEALIDTRDNTTKTATLSIQSPINGDEEIFNQNIDELIDSIPIQDKSIPSPSEILKNLCLSKDEDYMGILQPRDEVKNYDVCKDLNTFL